MPSNNDIILPDRCKKSRLLPKRLRIQFSWKGLKEVAFSLFLLMGMDWYKLFMNAHNCSLLMMGMEAGSSYETAGSTRKLGCLFFFITNGI